MKKILGFIFALFILIYGMVNTAIAKEVSSAEIINDMYIQKRISDIGLRLLNANKIDVRMIFVYDSKNSKL